MEFLLFLLAAVLKTILLWVIFLLVFKHILFRTFSKLNDHIRKLDLDYLKNVKLGIKKEEKNELGSLEKGVNYMIQKIQVSKDLILISKEKEISLKEQETII